MRYVATFVIIFNTFEVKAISIISDRLFERTSRKARNLDGSFNKMIGSRRHYDKLVRALIQRNYYFAAIPFAKEFLSSSRSGRGFESAMEKLIAEVGVRQFETLPEIILARSNAEVVRYIRAKKLFRRGQYSGALNISRGISGSSSIGPFVSMLRGSIYSISGNQHSAIREFEECAHSGGIGTSEVREMQYQITRDYCIIGKARALFALRRYQEATSTYLDLEKSSFIWPEILFEEAWSSFFQKNYNRTLGKLVTYKAPVFQNFFIPEIDILKSLAYMELCLWSDAKKTVGLFDQKYLRPSRELGRFIRSKRADHEYFYHAARLVKRGPVVGGKLYNKLLRSIVFEPGYQELKHTIKRGAREYKRLSSSRSSRASRVILNGIKDTIRLQKRLIGSYVRKQIVLKYALLRKAFTQMGYIKLEVLKRNKQALYHNIRNDQRERGDIKYLSRNDKQYFWSFNGEFWADELGDYVFALPSECRR